ncbi:MAG: riboflavin synthase [Phycisphaerales bacterium]|nr:riboflavin synthase [Phycisphaerales bacterium]
MFTGLIQHKGTVTSMVPNAFGAVLEVETGPWGEAAAVGESIAVDGCCLTVAAVSGGRLRFDVIRQTLERTALRRRSKVGISVNLERAATPSTLLGGHLVQGHVDGVGRVAKVVDRDEEYRIRVEPPAELVGYIVKRGSIAVDGVSLTVASIGPSPVPTWFEVALIPTTLELTNLGERCVNDDVNLETDHIVRAVVHWMRVSGAVPGNTASAIG